MMRGQSVGTNTNTKMHSIRTNLPISQVDQEHSPHKKRILSLTKTDWTEYMNDFNFGLYVNAKFRVDNIFLYAALCGFSSYHSYNIEDRRFRFKFCAPAANKVTTLPEHTKVTQFNKYNEESFVDCPVDSVVTRIYSQHDSGARDCRWRYHCSKFNGWKTGKCWWSDYVNNFDEEFNFECYEQGVIACISSYHNNSSQDRRFKFKCCKWEKDHSYERFKLREPIWPVDFRFSHSGVPSGYNCINVFERGSGWYDNFFCWKHGTKSPGLVWSYRGTISNMKCINIAEPSLKKWRNNYLCLPQSSPLDLVWSNTGQTRGGEENFIQWYEPKNDDTQNNYLCNKGTSNPKCIYQCKYIPNNQLRTLMNVFASSHLSSYYNRDVHFVFHVILIHFSHS